jgi:hypothetical protein
MNDPEHFSPPLSTNVRGSWPVGIFGTADEVSFAGTRALTTLVIKFVPDVSCVHFRLHQQYRFW